MTTRESFELSPDALAASDAFGNHVRVAVIHRLASNGPATRGALASSLDVNVKTLQFHLAGLRTLGVLHVRPVRSPSGDWHRQEYLVDSDRIDVLLEALRQTSVPDQP